MASLLTVSVPNWVRNQPRALLLVLAVLAVACIVSLALLIVVAGPPSYEPVPLPSVGRT